MFCSNCGAKIEDGLNFCTECGAKIEVDNFDVEPQTPKYDLDNRVQHSSNASYDYNSYDDRSYGESTYGDNYSQPVNTINYGETVSNVSASQLKVRAKRHLKGNLGTIVVATLLVSLTLFIPLVGTLLCAGCVSYGLVNIYLMTTEGRSPSIGNVFDGFKNDFGGCFGTYWLTAIYTLLWGLIPVAGSVICVIKSYSYSMAMYIKRDHPELTSNQAITASKRLMDGHKWQLFCLHLSFILWIFASMFTFFILYVVWVRPYMGVADAEFYNHYIKPRYDSIANTL